MRREVRGWEGCSALVPRKVEVKCARPCRQDVPRAKHPEFGALRRQEKVGSRDAETWGILRQRRECLTGASIKN